MTVADTPSLEVESSPAGSACCKTCSKDHVAHGKGGVLFQRKMKHQDPPAGGLFSFGQTFPVVLISIHGARRFVCNSG